MHMEASVNSRLSTPADLDRWLVDHSVRRESLCPDREFSTPFATLWRSLKLGDSASMALIDVSRDIADAILTHYPDNLFWDLDRLVHDLAGRGSPNAIRDAGASVVRLMAGFGERSEIRFRYIHDFTYGFDWAKWVAREPEARQHVGPFDDVFLNYLHRRQQELLALIAADDETYGQLDGDEPRNPFGFSRDPEDERRLHVDLAQTGDIPVRSWDPRAEARWGARFAEVRDRRASAMGLARG